MAKMLGVRGQRLVLAPGGVEPPRTSIGVKVMSMDLLLPSDSAPLQWNAVTQDEAHTWRGSMEASALREFLTDTNWGELDLLLLDLPPGTDRLLTIAALVERLAGTVVVTIPSDVSHLVVRKRSEEHTSELQSLAYLVCRLLLEKKKKKRLTMPVDALLGRWTE